MYVIYRYIYYSVQIFKYLTCTVDCNNTQHQTLMGVIFSQVMPLENEMAKPERFSTRFGVLNCAMVPITLLYTVVGFFGYLKYGQHTQGSITLNLPNDQL